MKQTKAHLRWQRAQTKLDRALADLKDAAEAFTKARNEYEEANEALLPWVRRVRRR